jgi:hypothetical protein
MWLPLAHSLFTTNPPAVDPPPLVGLVYCEHERNEESVAGKLGTKNRKKIGRGGVRLALGMGTRYRCGFGWIIGGGVSFFLGGCCGRIRSSSFGL